MIGYDLLLGHVAPLPISQKATPRKVMAKEMAGSVADQKSSNTGKMKIAARNRARILEYLLDNGPSAKTKVLDAVNITEDQFDRAINILRDKGKVRLYGQRRLSRWAAIKVMA